MNLPTKRTKLAEARGWTIIHDSRRPKGGTPHQIPPDRDIEWFMRLGEPHFDLPDYFNDLNDVRDFEKAVLLTTEQWDGYIARLNEITQSPMWSHRHVIGAEAHERAEALGQYLKLW